MVLKLQNNQELLAISGADFLVRSAYQMAKTPLLPLFAAGLGATDATLGFIVSVSTITGMILKPLIGILSDRWGRRPWLLIGLCSFVVMPFTYRFITTPEQLIGVRLAHGMATAVFGPVTLAFVVEQSQERRAERVSWFSLGRSGGYIVGPALAGWLLLVSDPETVFTLIGIISLFAVPLVLRLPETSAGKTFAHPSIWYQMREGLAACGRSSAIWLSGGLEAAMYIATYAIKAFLPLYAVAGGISVALVGIFFAVQEGVQIIARPSSGRLGDRFGYRLIICVGLLLLGVALLLITRITHGWLLLVPAILLGLAQAAITPSTVALVSDRLEVPAMGAAMGVIGSLQNAGKVIGPILAGILIRWFEYTITFQIIGLSLISLTIMLAVGYRFADFRLHP